VWINSAVNHEITLVVVVNPPAGIAIYKAGGIIEDISTGISVISELVEGNVQNAVIDVGASAVGKIISKGIDKLPMPGRSFNSGDYKYGMNGQEKDDEIVGSGNMLAFEFREYDTRLGRFFAVDPLSKKYPELTPYQFASNTPIWAKELEGLEANYTSETKADPFGGTETAGTKSEFSGPRSEGFMEENKLVEGSTKASAIGVKTTVDVFVGRSGITGGKLGGHAILNLGDQGAFSFSNRTKKDEDGTDADGSNHLFAKSGDNANSIFKNYSPTKYNDIKFNSGKESVSFNLDVTLDQRQSIIDTYKGTPGVDYSVTGWRCASMCLKTLNNIGVIQTTDFKMKYIHAPTPGSLIKYLESKGFKGQTNPGDPNINWNNPLKK